MRALTSRHFHFDYPIDIVRITTSLSQRAYETSISPSEVTVEVKSVTGPRVGPVSFNFDAKLKHEVAVCALQLQCCLSNALQEVPVQGISSFFFLLVLPIIAFQYREQLTPVAKSLYSRYLAFREQGAMAAIKQSGTSGSSARSKRTTNENDFDFLPANLKSSKQKTKTK